MSITRTTVAEWLELMRAHAARCRQVRPLPDSRALSLAEVWQYRIVGGTIDTWLRQIGPRFLQERAMMAGMLGVDPEPAILFTSNVPGLVAAQELVGTGHNRVVFLLEDELAQVEALASS